MFTHLLRLLSVLVLPSAVPAVAQEIVLQNDVVRRVFAGHDGVWRTVRFERADGSDALEVDSDEFLIRMMDGRQVTVRDFGAADRPEIVQQHHRQTMTIDYVPRSSQLAQSLEGLTIRYTLADEPYLRKQIFLRLRQPADVDRLDVERFRTKAPCHLGGRGQPVFIADSWFMGLEYPGSETACTDGEVTLAHFPGSAELQPSTGKYVIAAHTAVAGVGTAGDPLELAFSDYLDTIRQPSRVLLHYNSWYDLRANELSTQNLIETFESFKNNVLELNGLTMQAFVPDDGWQDPESIWQPRPNLYPDGFAPLSHALEQRGTRLGIWMPFNGFNLDVDWGVQQGYAKSNQGRYYCLVAPKYHAAIEEVCRRLIRQGNIAYFKHDFNQLRCSEAGHGHLPNERHGHEANLDVELQLLALERQLQPDVFLNVTSYVWHSPWWLQHADTIWMAAGDFGYNQDWPQLAPREWAMSYRDAHFYKLYKEQHVLVPLSAMMTHGIIHGRYQLLGGEDETMREWSDYVVMYYGRGVQLMEWYITPSLMTPQRWEILGRATRWAIENKDVLENVILVGGDPRRGRPYGYVHWKNDRGLLVLRNPDVREQVINLSFDKSVRYRGPLDQPFKGRVIYPFVQDLDTQFRSGAAITMQLPGYSVIVCELLPGSAPTATPVALPPAPQSTARIVRPDKHTAQLRATIQVPDETMLRCDLYIFNHSRFGGPAGEPITLNDAYLTPRTAQGGMWSIQSVDLMPQRGRTANVTLTLGAGDSPFSRPADEVSAWLVMDRQVEASGDALENIPLPVAQGYRRQTDCILAPTTVTAKVARDRLTAEELGSIRAAKLRIIVFDSNSDQRYRDKFIYLNDQRVARVPANTGPLSSWQEHIIDLQANQLRRLQLRNAVFVDNPVGDYFKFGGVALAVQLPDGRWVESSHTDDIHSSIADWSYAEGHTFVSNRSNHIPLSLD